MMRALRAPLAVIGIAVLLGLGCCLAGQLGVSDNADQSTGSESGAAGGMSAPYSATLTTVHTATERLLPSSPAASPRLGLSTAASESLPHGSTERDRSTRTSLFLEHCSLLC